MWVVENCGPNIPHADDNRIPFAVRLEHPAEFSAKRLHPVPDAWLTKLPDIPQILSNLSIRNPDQLAKLARTHRCRANSKIGFKGSQIEAQPFDGWTGDVRWRGHEESVGPGCR